MAPPMSEFIWKFDLSSKSKEYIELKSPVFHIVRNDNFTTTKWTLNLYPNGSYSNSVYPSSSVSLYLENSDKKASKVSAILSILNQNNVRVIEKSLDKKIDRAGVLHGFPRYADKSFIYNPRNNLIENNMLTVSCQLVSKNSFILKNKKCEERFSKVNDYHGFEKLFLDKDYSDISLIVDGKYFHAHKCILASHSPVFDSILKNDTGNKNIKLDGIEFEVFGEVMRFIYTGKVEKIEKIVCKLLSAAEEYSIEDLKTQCENVMISNINEDNALKYLSLADTNNAIGTKAKVIKWILLHVKKFFKNSEFKSFGLAHPELFYEIMEEYFKDS